MTSSIYTFDPNKDKFTANLFRTQGSYKNIRGGELSLHTNSAKIRAIYATPKIRDDLKLEETDRMWKLEIDNLDRINDLFPDSPFFVRCLAKKIEGNVIAGFYLERADCDVDDLFFDHHFVNPVTKVPYDERGKLKLAQTMMIGISLLHGKNLTHRDISMQNLLVFNDTIKITDISSLATSNSPTSRKIGGTNLFKAPEIFIAWLNNEVDEMPDDYPSEARDLWGAGVVMLYLLEKSRPEWCDIMDTCQTFDEGLRIHQMMITTHLPDRFGLLKLAPKERTQAADAVKLLENDSLLKSNTITGT